MYQDWISNTIPRNDGIQDDTGEVDQNKNTSSFKGTDSKTWTLEVFMKMMMYIDISPLNTELNPICQ